MCQFYRFLRSVQGHPHKGQPYTTHEANQRASGYCPFRHFLKINGEKGELLYFHPEIRMRFDSKRLHSDRSWRDVGESHPSFHQCSTLLLILYIDHHVISCGVATSAQPRSHCHFFAPNSGVCHWTVSSKGDSIMYF